MKKPRLAKDENHRLQELNSYDILGEVEQEDFDFLTRMAAEICNAKISLITLITDDKQWFLSHHGLELRETPKDYSFCAHAINAPREALVIEDATKDERFQDNPLVTGHPNVIFYAGIPLVNENNAALGSICVIDESPRSISEHQLKSLRLLADQAIKLLELRRNSKQLKEKREDLHKKEELLNVMQSMNDIGTWELDLETGKRFWSEEVYKIHEVDKDFDHNNANLIDFYHPDDRAKVSKAQDRAIETGEPFELTVKLITDKNNLRWVRSTGHLYQGKEDNKNYLMGSFQDISNLKESEEKFQSIFNSSFSLIGFLSPDGTLLEANDTALQMAGITRDDVIGKKFWNCYWWQISEQTQNELKENIIQAKSGEEVTYEVEVWIKDKTPVTILFSLRPVFDAQGKVKFIVPEGRPIQDIVAARRRYKSVIEGTNVGTWEWNVQTGATIFNERWAEIAGYTLDELEPVSIDTWRQLAHPEDLEESSRKLKKCFDKKADYYDMESRLRHKEGHWVWVQDRGKVFEWTNGGKPLKMYGTHQDITERKRKEEALRVSEEAFRGNFENAAIGMALLDENGKWLKVNKRVCEIVGYSEEELMELTFQDITHPEDLNTDLRYLNEVIGGERDNYQMGKRYFHKNGQVVHIILAVSVVRDGEGEILYFISQLVDVTDKEQTEHKLQEALSSLQAVMDASTQVSIIATDAHGTITTFNKGAEKMLGYREDEVVGKHKPQLIHLDKEIEQKSEALSDELGRKIKGFDVFVEEAKEGKAGTSQWTYKRKNGTTYPVLLSVTAIERDNEITGILSVATDISELEKAKKELRLFLNFSEKQNERLKNFAHIVTHNLRSHTTGISGMLDLIEMDYPDIFGNEYIKMLNKASDNLNETIQNLTEIVKQGFVDEKELKKVNLKKVVQSNISSAVTTVGKDKVDIINEVEDDIELKVIPAYLDSIIMNFLTNAIKYRSLQRDSYVKIHGSTNEDYIQLSFEDNGVGMDLEKYEGKLFGMYNTFHDNEDSRGVGLFITKNQIESMGGYVEVESEVDHGTTFKVFLPKSVN